MPRCFSTLQRRFQNTGPILADLETNQVAQYILDRIQEDLQYAIYQNDGNLWMAATILTRVDSPEKLMTDGVINSSKNQSLKNYRYMHQSISFSESNAAYDPTNEGK